MKIPGYHILSNGWPTPYAVVYRARRDQDGLPVLLKLPVKPYPVSDVPAWLEHEYRIASRLDLEGVLRPYGIERHGGSSMLVFEDVGADPLAEWMKAGPLSLKEALQIGIGAADVLAQLHAEHITHKGVHPAHILWNRETGRLKLTGFEIASEFSQENPAAGHTSLSEYALAYVSPEQTGRMNRLLDSRTDGYSLGATLYEVLTGSPPFVASDTLELVHCHMAVEPLPPSEAGRDVPEVLSDLVMKLLSKAPEDRYQSAVGIAEDLKECLRQLETGNRIATFPLGGRDFSDRLQIPQRLYGREAEVEILLGCFERAAAGTKEVMLVTGAPGSGKSALVQEIQKTITRKRGYFIQGKFEQFRRSAPYGAFVTAFTELVKLLLTESEARLREWKQALDQALHPIGQLVVEWVPELDRILGSRPPVPEVSPAEAQNRFNLLLERFVAVFARPDHPLVIFLDDLQWADPASLGLLRTLALSKANNHLLVIGAYRDNEVDADHPLTRMTAQIKEEGAAVARLTLAPLNPAAVGEFVEDSLRCDVNRSTPLAEWVHRKTKGNPLFLVESLKSWHRQGLIHFDFGRRHWDWDLDRVRQQSVADDVVDLMTAGMRGLAEAAQHVLGVAACFGGRFDPESLAHVARSGVDATDLCLREATAEGLLIPLVQAPGKASYRFSHDRIQQAAYSLLSEATRKRFHRAIGLRWLAEMPEERLDEKICEIVNQLNLGLDPADPAEEQEKRAELNLRAARKARRDAAFEQMHEYAQAGLRMLRESCWKTRYELTLGLHLAGAEAAYLAGDGSATESLVEAVNANAASLPDSASAYDIRIRACIHEARFDEAIHHGLTILERLGVKFLREPTRLRILLALLRTRIALAGKRVEALADLPRMGDTDKLAAVRIMTTLIPAVYYGASELVVLFTLKLVELSVRFGNAPPSAYGYAAYGVILCGATGAIDQGHRFGELAFRLLDRGDAGELKCKTHHLVCMIRYWKNHNRTLLGPFLQTFQIGLETGDLEYGQYALVLYLAHGLLVGKRLDELEAEIRYFTASGKSLTFPLTRRVTEALLETVLVLAGKEPEGSGLLSEAGALLGAVNGVDAEISEHRFGKFVLAFYGLLLCYHMRKASEAVRYSLLAERHVSAAIGQAHVPAFYFYAALAELGIYGESDEKARRRIRRRAAKTQRRLKRWAAHAPENHLHRYDLVEAERRRVLGDARSAIASYDKAIENAGKHEYVNEQALAYERAGRFLLETGETDRARPYLEGARECYRRWGAMHKVRELEEVLFPGVSEERAQMRGQPVEHDAGVHAARTRLEDGLDLASAMKASRAISEETDLEVLLEKLMKTAIENAGAEKGCLVMTHEDDLAVFAEVSASRSRASATDPLSLEGCGRVSPGIVRYVARTREDVVLEDPGEAGRFTDDRYVVERRPRSVLCIPILLHGDLTGVLYLENNRASGAFTTRRVEILKLFCAQAAVSIENAKSYEGIRESERRYRSLYENAVEGIFSALAGGRLQDANPAMAGILGYAGAEEFVSAVRDIKEKCFADSAAYEAFEGAVRRQGAVVDFETELRRRDGDLTWVSISARGLFDGEGRMSSYEGSLIDVNDRKAREKAEQDRRAAEALSKAKSEFLENISHEIRTPLTLILSPVESVMQGDYRGEIDETFFRNLHRNIVRLLEMINDILDYSVAQSGATRLQVETCDLCALLEGYVEAVRSVCEARRISVEFVCHARPLEVAADRAKLDRVLANLFSNALKFTAEGGRIQVALREDADRCILEFKDTGVGIPSGKLDSVFDRFARVGRDSGRLFEGTGIGLALVKEYVEMHGGVVTVESRALEEWPEDHGSTFTVTLPKGRGHLEGREDVEFFATPRPAGPVSDRRFRAFAAMEDFEQGAHRADAAAPAGPGGRAPSAKLLVVEDNREMGDYLKQALEEDYEVHLAEDGRRGLETAREIRPDLILTDIMMPVMDGYELTRRIREEESLSETPVILLSARSEMARKIEGLQFGADDYVTKPFNTRELLARIDNLLKLSRRTRELRRAQARLLEQERILTERHIAGGMAHEIRNALGAAKLRLNSILGGERTKQTREHLQALLEAVGKTPELPEDKRKSGVLAIRDLYEIQKVFEKAFRELARSTERGLEITNRVMNYSRLDAGESGQEVRVDRVIRELIASYGESIREMGIDLQVVLEEGLTVTGSESHLHSVFQNLLLNARDAVQEKGGEAGRIRIAGAFEIGRVVVEVEDNGIGIPESERGRLFQPFYSTKPASGIGLGLSECRKVVGRHAGSIEVVSAVGRGSIFRVFLPGKKAPPEECPAPASEADPGSG